MFKKISKIVFASILWLSGSTYAATYSFQEITNNSPINIASQLSVDVTSVSGGVLFTFNNAGPLASSITDIYFSSGSFLTLPMSITDSGAGVAFDDPATPGNLPGGSAVGFTVTAGFSADSDSPVSTSGVNPGEWIALQFGLGAGESFASVTQALDTGAIRIGLHVQALGDGESESYVTPIPEPEIYAMMGLGLGLMGFVARRRKQQPTA